MFVSQNKSIHNINKRPGQEIKATKTQTRESIYGGRIINYKSRRATADSIRLNKGKEQTITDGQITKASIPKATSSGQRVTQGYDRICENLDSNVTVNA